MARLLSYEGATRPGHGDQHDRSALAGWRDRVDPEQAGGACEEDDQRNLLTYVLEYFYISIKTMHILIILQSLFRVHAHCRTRCSSEHWLHNSNKEVDEHQREDGEADEDKHVSLGAPLHEFEDGLAHADGVEHLHGPGLHVLERLVLRKEIPDYVLPVLFNLLRVRLGIGETVVLALKLRYFPPSHAPGSQVAFLLLQTARCLFLHLRVSPNCLIEVH